VIEKSTGVTNFEIGDEIYCRVPQEQMGTIAEFVAVNSELVAKKAK
jgi:NADPH:quinone reductase-like Zn-dependent oxidoreductase